MRHKPKSAIENPFVSLGAGRLFAYAIVSGIASGISGLFISWIWPEASTALQAAVFGLNWYALFLCLLVRAGRRADIKWPRLLGKSPSVQALPRLTAVAVPLAAISVGSQFVVLLPLSYSAPSWVGSLLFERCEFMPTRGTERAVFGAIDAAVTIMLAPVTEELLCRGYLLHVWGLKWGTRRAVLLTSVLFGALHLEPEHVISGFAHGLVFSILYLQTRSLVVPVAVHSANNLLALIVSLLPLGSICSVSELRSSWWVGTLGVAAGLSWLIVFWRQRGGHLAGPLPYEQPGR